MNVSPPASRPASALDFLLTRRSYPAKTLVAPVPDRDGIRTLLTAAARVPDHGKLVPWRFIVLERPALDRLSRLIVEIGTADGRAPEDVEKQRRSYAESPLAIAVVFSPKASEKIPELEQLLSSGAVCFGLLNAALASGWGANWLTGWGVYDPQFRARGLGLAENERVIGVVHVGTVGTPTPDRPRPDVEAVTTWAEG